MAKVVHHGYPVALKLTSCTTGNVIFEKSLRDFPKKLRYKFNSITSVSVLVSGEKAKGFSLDYIAEK